MPNFSYQGHAMPNFSHQGHDMPNFSYQGHDMVQLGRGQEGKEPPIEVNPLEVPHHNWGAFAEGVVPRHKEHVERVAPHRCLVDALQQQRGTEGR